MRRLAPAAAIAAAILSLVACSGGSSGSAASSGSSSGTTASSSSSGAVTTTSAASSESSSSSGCADAPTPSPGVLASHTTTDVDGDRTADQVDVFNTGSASDPGPWQVLVTLSTGEHRVVTISPSLTTGAAQPVQALGSTPIGAGTPIVFLLVGNGASASIVGLVRLVGCDLVAVGNTGGPFSLAVGGTVTHLDGARCAADGLHVLSADSADGITYDASDTPYTFDGATATPGTKTTHSLSSDDPTFQSYGHITCAGIESP